MSDLDLTLVSRQRPRSSTRVLGIGFCWLLAGCTQGVGEPVAAGADAEDRDLAAYLQELHQAASELPQSGAIRGRLGMAYDANGFTDAAMTTYRQAAALDAGEFRWPYHLAFLQASRGLQEEAVASLRQALAIDPAYAPGWLHLGARLLDLNRNDAAAEAYRQALALGPNEETDVVANAGLARVLLRQGRAADAVELLVPLTEGLPHPHLRRLLAQAHRQSGQQSDEAPQQNLGAAPPESATPLRWRDERQEAKDEHVRGFHGLLSVAEQRLKLGRATEAATLLENLRETRPHDRTLLNNLSIAYKLSGRQRQALDILREGISVHPDYYLFHFNIATLYEDRDEPELAIDHFGRAVELDAGLIVGYERLGLLLVREERYDEALAVFEAMTPHGESATALYYRAMIEGARAEWLAAVASLQKAVQLDPTLAKGYVFLGRSLGETGRMDEAKAALERAAALGTHPREVAAARDRLGELERQRS